jgi:hypothetical protein
VANTLNAFRNGAVGFIDWSGVSVVRCITDHSNQYRKKCNLSYRATGTNYSIFKIAQRKQQQASMVARKQVEDVNRRLSCMVELPRKGLRAGEQREQRTAAILLGIL